MSDLINLVRNRLFHLGVFIGNRLGVEFPRAMEMLIRAQYWSGSQLKEHQNQALRNLIHYCYDNIPYYRSLMLENHLTPADIQSLDDLNKFPYLTKDIIRAQGNHLRSTKISNQHVDFRRSGGTTGEPIRIALDKRARAYEVAAYIRGFEWMGYKIGHPMIRLFGGTLGLPDQKSLRARIREWLFNGYFLPAFQLSLENTSSYIDAIDRQPGAVLVGYTSVVRNLAVYASELNLTPAGLVSIICTAETLPDQWRQEIADVFHAPVYSYYGCGEVNSIAYESSFESGYLVTQEHIILEAATGISSEFNQTGRGQVCVTTLFNYAMPLIRYLNGDVIELQPIDKDINRQKIHKIYGRVVDQLTNIEGYPVSGALIPHIVSKSGFPAWKYQVIQTAMNMFEVRYLMKPGERLIEEMKETFADILRSHVGETANIVFIEGDLVETIAGKHRFVINQLVENNRRPSHRALHK